MSAGGEGGLLWSLRPTFRVCLWLMPSPISYSEVPVPPAETSHTYNEGVSDSISSQWVPFRAVLLFRRQGMPRLPRGLAHFIGVRLLESWALWRPVCRHWLRRA